jgi:hypothetical protein
MPWRGEVIERALAVALGGGLLSVMLKLGTQAPDADPVFLTIVVAGGALNLYLVGAVANASLAAPGRSWAWRGVIGAVVALIAQAFSALFGSAPAAWDALLLTAPLWGGLGGVCGLPQAGAVEIGGEEDHESA